MLLGLETQLWCLKVNSILFVASGIMSNKQPSIMCLRCPVAPCQLLSTWRLSLPSPASPGQTHFLTIPVIFRSVSHLLQYLTSRLGRVCRKEFISISRCFIVYHVYPCGGVIHLRHFFFYVTPVLLYFCRNSGLGMFFIRPSIPSASRFHALATSATQHQQD